MAPLVSKDERRTLLSQLAAKRRQQHGTRGYADELEDSDSSGAAAAAADSSEEEESFATARSRPAVVLDDSSEDENSKGNRGASSRPGGGAGGGLRRLQKAGAAPAQRPQQPRATSTTEVINLEDSDTEGEGAGGGGDDLAAQLGGLSIRARPGSGGSGHSSRAAAPQRPAEKPSGQSAAAAGGDDEKCMVLTGNGEFRLNAKASQMLYPHQVEGVRWLWSLYCRQRGGILADDMGLGKTIQCAAFLAGLIESRLIRRAIVVAPKTLLAQWRKELGLCGLGSAVHEYGGTANERASTLDRVVRRRGVILTTYGMVLHNAELLAEHEAHDADEGPIWDIMICDEGHKLKNSKMKLREQLDLVPTALRVIISGTPIQNNLMEMWALFNFCSPEVLGVAADFRDQYEKVITNGSDKHATPYERERGAVAAARLRQDIGPYMLRREKKEVFKSTDEEAAGQQGPSAAGKAGQVASGGGAKPAAMPHKNDLIVWLQLKPMQRKVYQAFLNSDSVKRALNQTSSALAAITVLKKVCDHPALLSERAATAIVSGAHRVRRRAEARLGGGGGLSGSDVEEIEDSSDEEGIQDSEEGEWESDSDEYSGDDEQAARRRQQARQRKQKQRAAQQAKSAARSKVVVAPVGLGAVQGQEDWDQWASAELEQQLLDEVHTTGFAHSCKTVFVMALLKNLVAEGHRTLIFSQSRVMLNILESSIREEGWRFCRIDGSVASAAERQARVHQFQTSSSIPIFLLTSQVGGLGLTLTAADRVIILDPAWNPSTDNQSVDRAYRIGQKRDVVVYRLISCGTVEEKIYRRQVFKGGLSRTGMEEGEQFRYFAQQDLSDLFRLDPSECQSSRTQRELHDMHAHQRRETPELTHHLQYLAKLDCYAGVSDHDLLFSKKEKEAPLAAASTATAQPAAPAGSSTGGASWGGAAALGGGARAAGAGTSARKGVFNRTANQGWTGGSELSDMFAKAVTISGPGGSSSSAAAAVAAAARPPGSGWGSAGSGSAAAAVPSPTQRRLSGSTKDPQQERIEELEALLQRKRHLIALSSGLADGGKRVRSQIVEIEQELAEAKRAASGGSAGGTSSSTATGAGAAAGAGTGIRAATPAAAAAAVPLTAPLGRPSSSAAPQPARPAGGSGSTAPTTKPMALAAAVPLPSGKAPLAGGGQPAGQPPAAQPPVVLPAAAAVPKTAAPAPAAAPAPPGSKPAASPLFTRMRDMLWGGGKPEQPQGTGAGSKALAFGVPAGEAAAAARQEQQAGAAPPRSSAAAVAAVAATRTQLPVQPPVQQQARAPAAQQAPQRAPQQGQQGQGEAAAQPPVSLRELKQALMDTLMAIKQAESAGYFDRNAVERLRRRAERLTRQYKEEKERRAAGKAALL